MALNFLGRVFGSEKALEATVSGVKNGLDALVYTDEEKAEAASGDRSEARGMVIQWMQATQGQHLARRLIAISVTGVWLFQYFISWVCVISAVFSPAQIALLLNQAAQITTEHADGMTGAVMLILSFYFAAPHMDKIVGAAMNRFAK